MAKLSPSPPRRLVRDALWAIAEPLIGRPRVPDRSVLEVILFVLTTGCRWRDLPAEMNCGAGVTCWRRLREWERAGVWGLLQWLLLDRLAQHGDLDFERHCLGGALSKRTGGRAGRPKRARCATHARGCLALPELSRAALQAERGTASG